MLRITDIGDTGVDWSTVPHCAVTTKGVQARRLKPGDIVFARTGSTGNSLMIRDCPEEAVFASYLIRLRVQPEVADPSYVSHFFQSPGYWRQIASASDGGVQKGVNASKLKKLLVPLPPIEEQRRIAAVLDAAEALRSKRRQALSTLDTLTQAIFLDMFGPSEGDQHKWPVESLVDVVREGTTVTYGIVQAGDEFLGGIPYIRTGDISYGRIQVEGLRRTDPRIAERFPRSRVRVGEIVMSIRATVGTTAAVPRELDGANLTQGTARISPGEATIGAYLLE